MKIQVTETLKTRLKNTAYNGSRIAKDILKEINKNCDVREIVKGKYNCFGTKIVKTTGEEYSYQELVITCCNKDIENERFPDYGNPNAPWKKKYRTEMNATTFYGLFKNLPDYTDEEVQFFQSAIAVNSKIVIRKYNNEYGFTLGYDAENYTRIVQRGDSPLWNSCMRRPPYSDIAGDFYGNLCKAEILIAQDVDGYVYGRAIVWKNLETNDYGKVSLLDRIYFSHDFVYKMIQGYARNNGVTFRKRSNTYNSQTNLVNMNHPKLEKEQDINLIVYKEIRSSRWYRGRAPYLDTLDKIVLRKGKLYMTNDYCSTYVIDVKNTGGTACKTRQICPICGEINEDGDGLRRVCDDCMKKYAKSTDFGYLWDVPVVEYKDMYLPEFCFKDGKPKRGTKNWWIQELICSDSNE